MFFYAPWVTIALLLGLVAPLSSPYLHSLWEQASQKQLAEDRYWHILLHYRETLTGHESEADGQDFFFAPEGKTQPHQELRATLKAFFEPVQGAHDDNHPQCLFPARYHWLKQQLAFDSTKLQEQACQKHKQWLSNINIGSATMVFASAHMSSPASMYGHTFLRLDRKGAKPGSALLSFIVNYAAVPWSQNPLIYTFAGLFGGFPGRFSIMPYYVKVQEYSNFESRELWEYRLTLTPDELLRMQRHLWELGSTYFDYYFFTENCSYHILNLLEAARPTLDLQRAFHSQPTIPTDTLKAVVNAPDLVASVDVRTSLATQMQTRYTKLPKDGEELVYALVSDNEKRWDDATPQLDNLSAPDQALVLDAAYDLYRYRHGQEKSDKEASQKQTLQERKLLAARARVNQRSAPLEIQGLANPEQGHESSRVGLGTGVTPGQESYGLLHARVAFHDLLDRQHGFIRDSTLEMGSISLRLHWERWQEQLRRGGVIVENFDLVRMESISPWRGFLKPISWRIRTGWSRVEDLGCSSWQCTAGHLRGGPGLAFRAKLGWTQTYYVWSDVDLRAGPAFRPNYRISGQATAGAVWELHPAFRVLGEAGFGYRALGGVPDDPAYHVFRVGAAWSPLVNLQLRIEATEYNDLREGFGVLMATL